MNKMNKKFAEHFDRLEFIKKQNNIICVCGDHTGKNDNYCVWCGLENKKRSGDECCILRRSTQKYCKICYSTYSEYNHKYCYRCGTIEN